MRTDEKLWRNRKGKKELARRAALIELANRFAYAWG
jgi:hypothetical protein